MICTRCKDAETSCAACGGTSSSAALMGTAEARGGHWASRVARQVGLERDWPPYEGKAHAIALRKVYDLGGDDITAERRARACWEAAGREWMRMRERAASVYAPPADEPSWPE